MEKKLNERVNKYMEQMDAEEAKLEKVKQAQEDELRRKYNLKQIVRNDRIENVERKAKQDEYKREKIREKIQEADERGEKIK